MGNVTKAVIPAAGMGTRFLPATKAMPKEMLPVIDKPAIQYVVEEVASAGIKDVLIITGKGKRAIEEHFEGIPPELVLALEKKGDRATLLELKKLHEIANITYARQEGPLGLGHALLCAESFVGEEPFAVLLGDDIVVDSSIPCIGQLAQEFSRIGKSVIAVTPVGKEDVSKYGIVTTEGGEGRLKRIKGLVEKPKPEESPGNLAVIGRYVFTKEIFPHLKACKPGLNGEIQLADALCAMLGARLPIYAYEFSGKRYDLGDKADYVNATIRLSLKRPELKEKVIRTIRELGKEK